MTHKPQWDNWRCYRCNGWQASSAPRSNRQTPSGMTVAVCAVCMVGEHANEQHPLLDEAECPVCEAVLDSHQQAEVSA